MKKPESKAAAAKKKPAAHATAPRDDARAAQAEAVQALAAAMPCNTNKGKEFGRANAVSPARGISVEPTSAASGASTLSEVNASTKTGNAAAPLEPEESAGSLARARTDGGGQMLTTNQGVAIGDNQNSLKAGSRGPTLPEDFVRREKITHFDHERIRERISSRTNIATARPSWRWAPRRHCSTALESTRRCRAAGTTRASSSAPMARPKPRWPDSSRPSASTATPNGRPAPPNADRHARCRASMLE